MDAIEFMNLVKVDVFVTDFRMVGTTGVELAAKTRSLSNQNNCSPIIFYTAYVLEAEKASRKSNLQNTYFLRKPLPIQDLFSEIKTIVGK